MWFETVRQHEELYDGEAPSSVVFHKASTLTHLRLRDQGTPFHFPYSWYLFGTEAEGTSRDVHFVPGDSEDRTMAVWVSEEPEPYRGDRVADAIRRTVGELLGQYRDEEIEKAIDEVYTYAPFEFQRKYRIARIALGVTGRGSIYEEMAKSPEVLALLNAAMDEFPRERFPLLTQYVPPVRQSVERAWVSTLERDYSKVREIIESFWTVFCAFVRVDEQGHYGVGRSQLETWRDFAQMKYDLFLRGFGDIVVEMEGAYGNVEEDAILGPIFTRRESEQKRERAMIDEALPYLEGLEDTLSRLHLQLRGR